MRKSSNGKTTGFQLVNVGPTPIFRSIKNEWRREYDRKRYHLRMGKIKEFLGNKCVKCGVTENLEIDHVNKDDKAFTITQLWTLSWDKLVIELHKCQLLCRLHHRQKTTLDLNHKPKGTHGIRITYATYGCRCDLCSEVQKVYMQRYAEQKRSYKVVGDEL